MTPGFSEGPYSSLNRLGGLSDAALCKFQQGEVRKRLSARILKIGVFSAFQLFQFASYSGCGATAGNRPGRRGPQVMPGATRQVLIVARGEEA